MFNKMSYYIHPESKGTAINTGFKLPVLGTRVKGNNSLKLRLHSTQETSLPENFRYLPEMLTDARDQGQCGSCWAFAITTVMADIIKIRNKIAVPISVQNLLNCYNKSCDGADIDEALHHLTQYIPESESKYTGGNPFGSCQEPSDYHINLTKSETYQIAGSGRDLIRNMKSHIYHDGPIIGAMLSVFPDFAKYDGVSIYDPTPNQKVEGGHAIEILGWGKNNDGIEYWICRNSWGDEWPASHLQGMGKGWFYIRMGVNACRMEEVAYSILPIPEDIQDAVDVKSDDEFKGEDDKNYVNPPDKHPIVFSHGSNALLFAGLVFGFIALYILFRKYYQRR